MHVTRLVSCGIVAALLCVAAAADDKLVPAPASPPPGAVAMLADGRTLEGVVVKPGESANQVVLERGGEKPIAVAAQDLLALEFAKVPGRPVAPSLRLSNGDQLAGKITFPSARQVKIAAGWGSITAPLAWCSALTFEETAQLPGPVAQDTLFLQNDRVEGQIQGVANNKVTITVGGKPVAVEIPNRVHALALAPRDHSAEATTGLLLSLDFGGGERLTGRWVKLTPQTLTVKLEWGDTLDVPLAALSRMEVKNGKLVYLSDLKPSEVRQVPYLDGSFPFKVDRSVSGRPIRLAGKTYRRGLGTHSRCELTYALDGSYGTFVATLGIDDAVGGQGSVIYRVFGDEKPLYESPVVRGGDTPVEIKVDVKRVLLLRLEVDFADGGDVADHADWADARLMRQ